MSWWKRNYYEPDSTVSAEILFDYGRCVTEPYIGTKFIHQRRIKIYKKEALVEWADFLMLSEGSKIKDFSGVVYNLENGKIVETKFDLKSLLRDKYDENTMLTAAAFPSVKEGSVIEYNYTMRTGSYSIASWEFQHSIPVVWSEYELFFPGSLFGVTATIYGLYDLASLDVKREGKLRRYVMTNLPGFKEEPYMPPSRLYRSSIDFEQSYLHNGFKEEYIKDRLLKYGIERDSVKMDTRIIAQADIEIGLDGDLKGKIMIKKSGYDAILSRSAIKEMGEENYLKSEIGEQPWVVLTSEIENLQDTISPLVSRFELIIQNKVIVTDSFMYINPYLALKEEINPFNLQSRLYPVDLGSRTEKSVTSVFKLPDGYVLEQLPANTIFEIPDKIASFAINSSLIENRIYITSRLKTNKIIFNVYEYAALREFMSRVVSKKSEQIVLRKKP